MPLRGGGGGVGRLMAYAILNFHFDYLNPSLIFEPALKISVTSALASCSSLELVISVGEEHLVNNHLSYIQEHIGSTPGIVLFKVLFFALFLGKTLFLVLLLVLKKVTELFFALFLAPFSALFLELFLEPFLKCSFLHFSEEKNFFWYFF